MGKPKIALMLAPALLVIVLLFLGGLVFGFLQSVHVLSFSGQSGFSLRTYQAVFSSRSFWASFSLSLWIALASTLISSLLALVSALALRNLRVARQFMTFVFGFNLPIPHVVGAIMMLLLFSQSGFFSRLAFGLGLTDSPANFPVLVQDRFAIGVIFEYIWKETPFIGVNLLAALAGLDRGFEEVSSTLGANRWQRLRHVILPALLPSLLASSVIVFAFSFGAFEVPYLLGATSPSTLSVLAYRAYTDSDLNSRSVAIALGMVIALFTSVLIYVYIRLSRRFLPT